MARACVGVIVVTTIPGLVVASLLGLPFRSLRTWAVTPAFSLALVFLVAELAQLTSVPFGVATVCVVTAALAVAAFARHRLTRPLASADDTTHAEVDDEHTIALVLLAIGIGVGLLTWMWSFGGHGFVHPGTDGAGHGFLTARILATDSIDGARVLVSSPDGLHQSLAYYPMAMHASAAVATRLVGADVGRVLIAFTVLFAAVVLPAGMFVLARVLAPRSPLVAGFTALSVPFLALFPYGPNQFGDVPIVVGMALVPISVVFVTRAILSNEQLWLPTIGSAIAAALVLVTAIAVHSSQLPLIIFLAAFLVIERAVIERSPQMLLRAAGRGIVIVLLAVVFFAPSLPSFARGVSERSSYDNTPPLALRNVIGGILTLDSGAFHQPARQVLLALLASAGIVICLVRRQAVAWVLGLGILIAVTALAAVSDGTLSNLLSLPWYHGPGRVGWNRAFFVPFFAGVALAAAVAVIIRRYRGGRGLVIASLGVLAVFGIAIGFQGQRASAAMLRFSFRNDAPVTADSNAAFSWLKDHTGRNDTIVNDVNQLGVTTDDALWMYAQRGLRPLFGVMRQPGFKRPPAATAHDWNDRLALLAHLDRLGRGGRTDELARRYRARWVYFDERVVYPFRHTLRLADLQQNPRLREAFRRGPVHVFEIRD